MSDLAPFVAAALRDKTVAELEEENRQLRQQLETERHEAQIVTITGPRGSPVYAQGCFQNGKYDYSPELWKVDLAESRVDRKRCLVENLSDMEVRIGGVCKARLSNGIVEGFVNDVENNYDDSRERGTLSIWFGGSSGIWLNVQIEPIARHDYAALRDFDLGGESLGTTLLQFVPSHAQVIYTEVSFLISYVNGAMDRWGLGNEYDSEEEEQDDANAEQEQRHEQRSVAENTRFARVREDDDEPSSLPIIPAYTTHFGTGDDSTVGMGAEIGAWRALV